MTTWKNRPIEIANLLNPAFCGEIIRRCTLKYNQASSAPFPFLFTFIVLPLITHRSTRELIPTLGAPRIQDWIENHPEIKIGLARRIEDLAPLTKEAILFLSSHSCISVDGQGNIQVVYTKRPSILNSSEYRHPDNFYKKAEKLGQWLSSSGGPSVVFASLGVKL